MVPRESIIICVCVSGHTQHVISTSQKTVHICVLDRRTLYLYMHVHTTYVELCNVPPSGVRCTMSYTLCICVLVV